MRDTLRFWSSGVAVVSTLARTPEHPYAGMTISAFNSVSLEPPRILISIAKNSLTTGHLLQARVFAVSLLNGEQGALADRFAGRVPLPADADRFDGVAIRTEVTGAPILQDALAWLDCRVHTIHDGDTHWIVIGEVAAAGHTGDDSTAPLVYFNRAYYALTPEQERT
jgi:flavin reductase (DIM6/NTAB) family NADH-FMN oxidoreductase RutF